ncbi:hypothetical protein ABMA28_011394 [Loxostege sticticalis]|uniref:FP protein C-terminal domain-containing protein n=1 Tax=Loxostege sticticalis TaxID=481309 RepID=A0ABD0S8V8_LOXSC
MPVDRTPPQQTSAQTQPLLHCVSEPNLNFAERADMDEHNVTVRTKRKLSETSTDLDSRLSSFMSKMRIKMQNCEIQHSVEFLSHNLDSLKEQVQTLEKEQNKNTQYIQNWKKKLRNLRVVPDQLESKTLLLETVTKTLNTIQLSVQSHEIRDVFRITSKDPGNRPIIVDFTSVLMRDRVIEGYKKYNKNNSRLTTESLRITGPVKPIFISENLTSKMKRLFFLTRDFAKVNEFKYCWVSHGKIFLRKSDGLSLCPIRSESDLNKLKINK